MRIAASLLLLAACSTPEQAPLPTDEHALAELRTADRAYSADVAARGLEAWVGAYAADGVRVDLFGEVAQGPEAIRAADASLFADPAARLSWEPLHAAVFAEGREGLTRGEWKFSVGEELLAQGVYLTLWRRDAAGEWKVTLDTGAPRPPDDPHLRWSSERALRWYAAQPWIVGCNFIPSSASNQLEMWQADTFDLLGIRRELAWAAEMGLNSVRTYLHDLAYQQDPEGFLARVDLFLDAAAERGIRPVLVLFDDCWNDDPKPGPQAEPRPGVHNSRWARSPGSKATLDAQTWPALEDYVSAVIGRFGEDPRVLMWDLYNEPGNSGMGVRSLPLLRAVFGWARAVGPRQPLTAAVWSGGPEFQALNDFQVEASDVLSFHNYDGADALRAQIQGLKLRGRPLVCTEWLRRGHSEVLDCLPVFARENVAAFHWGLVRGRSNAVFPWGSPEGASAPKRWFHDLLEPDGTPHDPAEIAAFREWTARMRAVR